MPGYSATPLPKKLGLSPGQRVRFYNLPQDVQAELRDTLKDCEQVPRGALDYAHVFSKSRTELTREFARLARTMQPAGMLWVSWPKKTSGIATDLGENDVRRIGLAAGMVDVKVCAVTDVWSGLKFVFRKKDRPNR